MHMQQNCTFSLQNQIRVNLSSFISLYCLSIPKNLTHKSSLLGQAISWSFTSAKPKLHDVPSSQSGLKENKYSYNYRREKDVGRCLTWQTPDGYLSRSWVCLPTAGLRRALLLQSIMGTLCMLRCYCGECSRKRGDIMSFVKINICAGTWQLYLWWVFPRSKFPKENCIVHLDLWRWSNTVSKGICFQAFETQITLFNLKTVAQKPTELTVSLKHILLAKYATSKAISPELFTGKTIPECISTTSNLHLRFIFL